MIRFRIDDEIEIRQWTRSDATSVFEAVQRNHDHLRAFMEWIRPVHTLNDFEQFIEREISGTFDRTKLGFGIFRAGKLIGTIGFASFDHDAKVTEIGYWIDSREEGKGIVSHACKILIEYAFSELGMNRIQIRCATTNIRSAAIPERFGFVLEGVQRQHVVRDGKILDFAIYGLLASEWAEQKQGI